MVDFATPSQMADRTGGDIPATHPYLQVALSAASRLIRNDCRWHIATRETITSMRRGSRVEPVWLPAMQIESITGFVIDGVAHDAETLAAVEFDPMTGWTNLSGRNWSVTYVCGFDTVPEDITDLTLQIVARSLGSPLGISREQAGSVSVSYQPPGFMVGEKDQLAAYRIGVLP